MRKTTHIEIVFIIFSANFLFVSASSDSACNCSHCPEVSQVKNVGLYDIEGTLYPFLVNEDGDSGFLSDSDCLEENQNCSQLVFTAQNLTHGFVEECCSGSCKTAPVVINFENGELITESGIICACTN